MMQYVGVPYAYGIVQISSGSAPMSIRAPVAISSLVIWPGLQSWWIYGGYVAPLPCECGDWFFSLVNRDMIGRVFGAPNPSFAELSWHWPDEGSTECNRTLTVEYVYAQPGQQGQRPWAIGTSNRTAADQLGVMDSPILGGPYGTGGGLYLHDFGMTDNGAPRAATGAIYAETGAITLGDGDQRYNIVQVVMDGAGTDPANPAFGFRFFVREQASGAERDTGLYTVAHDDGLFDVRFSGRSVRMRIEALRDVAFAVGKTRLVMTKAGMR
jgi:hypothetical protein